MRRFDGVGRKSLLAGAAVFAAISVGCLAPASARDGRPPKAPSERLLPASASGPVTIVVSTDAQRLTVYDGNTPVARTIISTGVADHPTPHGVFSVIEKQVFHRSTIYDDAPMPFMQRLTWSGIAMHEGHVTGRPASHGCVRLPAAFAKDLFRYTRRGVRVVISRADVTPDNSVDFAAIAPPPARRFVMGEQADDGRFAGEISGPNASVGQARVAPKTDIVAASPITALVSRKTGRIYVRRAFAPIFEAPITIDNPDRPLGAHLFVSMGSKTQMTWTATTVAGRVREAMLSGRDQSMATPLMDSSADQALRRIHLAPGTAQRLWELLTPGAALILSDDGARNRESWAGTNFIALSE
jgi:hypothetical protein